MHAGSITVGTADAGNVYTVIAQQTLSTTIEMEGAVEVKTIAGLNPLTVRIGIGAVTLGNHIHQFPVTSKFRMFVHWGIENPYLLPFTGITRSIGFISVDRTQPPVGLKFIAAPACRIAHLTAFRIGRSLYATGRQQRAQQGVQFPCRRQCRFILSCSLLHSLILFVLVKPPPDEAACPSVFLRSEIPGEASIDAVVLVVLRQQPAVAQ
ncbi:Uncharacterised protein [Serratia grimesii]|nr:Uncharacterised protein [Serratia grimesii]